MATYNISVERADESYGYATISYSKPPTVTIEITGINSAGNKWRVRGRQSLGDTKVYIEGEGLGVFTFESDDNKSYIFQIQHFGNEWTNTSNLYGQQENSIFNVNFDSGGSGGSGDSGDSGGESRYLIIYFHNNSYFHIDDHAEGQNYKVYDGDTPTKQSNLIESNFEITGNSNGGYFENSSIITKSIKATKKQTINYNFHAWCTDESGIGELYFPGETFIMPSRDIILYSYFTKEERVQYENNAISNLPSPKKDDTTPYTYTVKYDALGGNVSKTTDSTSTTRRWSFGGWATSSTASSANAQSSYTSATNLWAYWTYQDVKGTVTLPTPTRVGYKFLGWGTSKTQTSNLLAGGATPQISANTTYYAIWKVNSSIRIYTDNTKKYQIAMVWMYKPSSSSDTKPWKLVIPYMKTQSNWKITAG